MPPAEESKKYVRTFAGDLAALQGAAQPAQPAPEASPAVPAPQAPTPPLPVPVAPLPPEPLPAPIAPSGEAHSMPPPITGPTPIHTYAGDFSQLVKEENASTATVLAAQEDRGEAAPVLYRTTPRSSYAYVIGGVALLLVGIGAALFTYTQYLASHGPVALLPMVGAPIFVDDRAQIGTGNGSLTDQINASVAKPLGMSGVRLLYTSDSLSGTSTVFSALKFPAPGALTRNILQTGGMAGVINVSGTQSPFFILKVTSYADTFAAMLAWEQTMPRDLAGLFPAFPVPAAATTTATSTARTSVPASVAGFRDETVANHDVRMYLDSAVRPVFLYGYWDPNTLVIARDPAAFGELMTRLANSRTR